MTKGLTRCANCDYFQPGEVTKKAARDVTTHGECRRRPPAMYSRRVIESDPVPVFDDTSSYMKVPVTYETLCPAYPAVNEDFWCGDGRWTAKGAQYYWSRLDDKN